MTGKDKRFPLSLSSLGNRAARAPEDRNGARRIVATPQTATSNAASHAARRDEQQRQAEYVALKPAGQRGAGTVALSDRDRPTPLISPAVRRAMVERIARQGVQDTKVLAAMEAVPRHLFMEPALASQAYIDASLPIGHHQTISQPYIVARMIEVMRANMAGGVLNRVLEIGTGCGYQAAVLSLVAKEVYSIERIKPLHELARSNLRPMRIPNVRLHYGDGMLGLPQVAPFDGIILAAAGLEIPPNLLEQLTIGGRLVAPVGGSHQVLQLVERVGLSEWTTMTLEDCHFVPLRAGTV